MKLWRFLHQKTTFIDTKFNLNIHLGQVAFIKLVEFCTKYFCGI